MKKPQHIILVGALLSLLLSIIFLFNEFRSFNPLNTFDSTKFQTVLQIFGIAINCLTIYFLLLQSDELKASREEMVKGRNETVAAKIAQRRPELFPQDLFMITNNHPNINHLNKSNSPIPLFLQENSTGFTENHDCIISNIGIGPAINLNIEWIYDDEEVKEYIGSTYDTDQTIVKNSTELFVIQDKSIIVSIPYFYLMLYGKDLNLTTLDVACGQKEEKIKPSLLLKLTYNGTFEESYSKTFKVNFHAIDNKIKINFSI